MHRKRLTQRLLAGFIIIASLALVIAIALRLSRDHQSAANDLDALPEHIDISLQGIHFNEIKDGVKQWELIADRADYDRKADLTRLRDVRMVIAGDSKSGTVTLTADRAVYHNASRNVELAGHVLAVSSRGVRFSTDAATYLAADQKIVTDERVMIREPRLTVTGKGMVLLVKEQQATVLDDVEATILPEGK
jgi:LPS export ABC transporter protein LptC